MYNYRINCLLTIIDTLFYILHQQLEFMFYNSVLSVSVVHLNLNISQEVNAAVNHSYLMCKLYYIYNTDKAIRT